jgi:hypothetical protein
LIIVAQILLYGVQSVGLGCLNVLMGESFATKYRYSGSGIAYQFGVLLWTGMPVAVLLPMFLVNYGVVGAWQPVSWAAIAMCIVAVVATFFVKETSGTTLE